jgi:uncharacterized membrane protein
MRAVGSAGRLSGLGSPQAVSLVIQRGMSATISQPTIGLPNAAGHLRFGARLSAGGDEVQWLLKRNCSATPRQVAISYAGLSALVLAIGAFLWFQGATLVAPFAGIEVLAVGAALLLCARHAGDREHIRLLEDRLLIETVCGHRVERIEFMPAWVRVEPQHGERSLIEISGQGRRIVVGRFVRPELRRALADELRGALRRAPGARSRQSIEPSHH